MTAKRERHGLSLEGGKRTRLHRLWLALRNRCNNPRAQDYARYGGRGIKVCPAWDRFVQFVQDVGPHPGPGWTLDRENNNGDYEPGNVRWATRKVQGRNRNYCRLDAAKAAEIRRLWQDGARQVDLAAQYGVSQKAISDVTTGRSWI